MIKEELGELMNELKKNDEERVFEKEHGLTIIEKHEQFYTIKDNQTGDIYTISKEEIIKPKTIKEKAQALIGIIFLIWFVGSLILIIHLSNVNPIYSVICFGQYFLVFGLIALCNKVWPGLIFAIIGLGIIIVSVLSLMPNLSINWDIVLPILLLSVFIIVGIGLMTIPTIVKIIKKKKTSFKVMGKVIDLEGAYEEGTKVFAPVYEFYFNGKTYRVKSNVITNVGVPKIGEVLEIMIDPNNPEEFYVEEQNKTLTIILFGMGILLVGAGIGALYLFLMTN